MVYLAPHFIAFLCFLSVISLFRTTPKHSGEVLGSASKHKKAVMGLMEKIHVLNKICPSMSYNALDMSSVLINQY